MYAHTSNRRPGIGYRTGLLSLAVLFCASSGLSGYAAPSPFEVADRLDLVPTPQSIALTGQTFELEGWTIMTPDSSDLAQTGAEEVNDRIARLGGKALPVLHAPVEGNTIVIAPRTHDLAAPYAKRLEISSSAPGEQGYAIGVFDEGGRTILAAVGGDDPGALYACMTIRQLIQERDGKPVLLGARVRDWPAFKRRCLGKIGRTFRGRVVTEPDENIAEATYEEFDPYVKFLARHKINMADISIPGSAGVECRKRLMELGRRYGLKYRFIYGTAINQELKETGMSWTDCVTRRSAQHCWTAFEAHKLKARKIAEQVRDMGYDYVVHHVTDSGGLPDPEKWSDRCERCREHYGDDHPRAAAEQLKLYHDTIKELNPDVLFEAVIQPYHFQWTVEGFCDDPTAEADDMPHYGHTRGLDDPEVCRRVVERAAAIHRAVAEALPPDALVTFREAGRPEFDGVCELWQRHPVDIWVYYGRNQAWEGLIEPQVRFTRTWYRNEPRDLLYYAAIGRMSTVNEVYAATGVEYAWNLNQPDAEPAFTIQKRRYLTGGNDVSDYQRTSLLPRICRRLWGRSGEAVVPLFAENVSFNYMGNPEYVASTRGEDFEDPYLLWDEQTKILRDARPDVNAAVAAMEAGRPSGVYGILRDEPGYTSFMYLYYYTNLAALKGEIENGIFEVKRFFYRNEMDKAQAAAEALQARLPEIAEEAAAVKEKVQNDSNMTRTPYYRETPPDARSPYTNEISGYPFEKQAARVESLIQRLKSDALSGGIPDHLRAAQENRTIDVAPVEFRNPFRADGNRGEGGWTADDPVEFFTVGNNDGLARFATRVWVRRDDEALYLFAELHDPTGLQPEANERPRDGNLLEDDCFEILLITDEASETCYRFAVNAAGSILDAHEGQPANEWNPDWQAGTSVAGDFWTAEMRIPFAALGAKPKTGDVWRINMLRRRVAKSRDPRTEVSSIIASSDPVDVGRFCRLNFVDSPHRTRRDPAIRLLDVRRSNQTVTYGFATQLRVRPEVQSWRQSRNARVAVAVFKGERRLAQEQFEVPSLNGYWKPAQPIDFDLGDTYEGPLRVVVAVDSADGTIEVTKTFSVEE